MTFDLRNSPHSLRNLVRPFQIASGLRELRLIVGEQLRFLADLPWEALLHGDHVLECGRCPPGERGHRPARPAAWRASLKGGWSWARSRVATRPGGQGMPQIPAVPAAWGLRGRYRRGGFQQDALNPFADYLKSSLSTPRLTRASAAVTCSRTVFMK